MSTNNNPINAWHPSLSESVPFCSRPPETLPLGEVDGGIPLCPDCGSTFYRDELGSCYDCFFPSDDRGE